MRPCSACVCHCVQPVATEVQVLVLQHPLEVGHAKNTGRLLHLCLPRSRLAVQEVWPPEALDSLLHAPWDGDTTPPHTVLLYPPTPADPQLPVVAPPPLPAAWLQQPARLRLVVLDGTWRKSRKMLYANPGLQQLPRWSLHDVAASRYVIRKAHAPNQLSSFEATAYALAALQRWPAEHPGLAQLLHSFDRAMAWHQQLQRSPLIPPKA